MLIFNEFALTKINKQQFWFKNNIFELVKLVIKMKILVVSATEKEILPLKNKLRVNMSTKYNVGKDFVVDFLVTGIGGALTMYALIKKMSENIYDIVINAGISGSFNSNLNVGDVVFVESDQFADLGIEDKDKFYTVFEKGFIDQNQFPFKNSKLENPNNFNFDLKKVSAITVNTTHGNNKSINLFKNKFNADIETMEGAAFTYVCLQEKVKFMQIRSISNYVEERNSVNWNIPLAIKNLNQKLFELIHVLEKKELNS